MSNSATQSPAEKQPPFPEQKQAPPGSDKNMTPAADHGENSYRGHSRLQDKVAIITGADSGIGRAVAIAFAREGADVLVSHLPEEESDAKETLRHIEAAGRKGLTLAGDISDRDYRRQLLEAAGEHFGGLDLLINNAGFQRTYADIADVPEEEFERTFRVNVFGTFFLTQAALAHMRRGGSIINTASIQAYEPSPGLFAYSPTKAAIVNMTKSLAKAAMDRGIRINAVAPGPVWTPLIPSTMPEEKVKEFGANTVFQRPAQPAELAPLYVFLASEEARYMTGEVIGATGGRTPF